MTEIIFVSEINITH